MEKEATTKDFVLSTKIFVVGKIFFWEGFGGPCQDSLHESRLLAGCWSVDSGRDAMYRRAHTASVRHHRLYAPPEQMVRQVYSWNERRERLAGQAARPRALSESCARRLPEIL